MVSSHFLANTFHRLRIAPPLRLFKFFNLCEARITRLRKRDAMRTCIWHVNHLLSIESVNCYGDYISKAVAENAHEFIRLLAGALTDVGADLCSHLTLLQSNST